MGDSTGGRIPLTELTPCGSEKVAAVFILIGDVKFIHENVGFLPVRPVVVDPVDHGISDGDEPWLLQLLTQIVDVIGLNTVFDIHIGFMGEDIQRAGGIQLHGKGQIPCFLLWLFQQLFPQGAKRRNFAGLFLILKYQRHTAVNDGLVVCPDTVRVDLLQKGHDKLGFERHRAPLSITFFHSHGIEPVRAAHRKAHDSAAQRLDQRRILPFRVQNNNVILRRQGNGHNQQLGKEGFAGTGNAQQHHGLVQQVFHIAQNQVMGDCILPKVNSSRLLNLLHLEGHEHRKALCGQGTEGINLLGADG